LNALTDSLLSYKSTATVKSTLAVENAKLTDPLVLYHFAVGLGSVIGAGLDKVEKEVHPTKAWEQLCPAYDALPPGEQ
jgi:hypothetical protein